MPIDVTNGIRVCLPQIICTFCCSHAEMVRSCWLLKYNSQERRQFIPILSKKVLLMLRALQDKCCQETAYGGRERLRVRLRYSSMLGPISSAVKIIGGTWLRYSALYWHSRGTRDAWCAKHKMLRLAHKLAWHQRNVQAYLKLASQGKVNTCTYLYLEKASVYYCIMPSLW